VGTQIEVAGDWELGVDIGGTFTDLVVYDRSTGRLSVAKVSSTPDDPSRAMLEALSEQPLPDLARFIHASTVVLNSLLQRRGAEIAMITTLGFRDHVEIGDTRRYTGGLFNARWRREKPLAMPHSRRLTIAERTLFDGTVIREPDTAEMEQLAQGLAELGVEGVAVCLLNSYKNPANENAVAAFMRERLPEVQVVTSSQVPEFREYPRFTTAILNCFCAPVTSRYVAKVDDSLSAAGFERSVSYMGSSGGIATGSHIVENPTTMLWGGVVGGVTASSHLGRLMGIPHMVTLDMGGTSTDVALIRDNAPSVVAERTLGAYPLAVAQVDVHSIGAGGGSIAYMEEGMLKVGPKSAGAIPGPACYGRGGEDFTVTDANVVLGRIRPASRLPGGMALDVEKARAAGERLLAASGLGSVEDLANGVIEIANTHMYGAIREVSVERGEDPAELALIAFGGAGPMHACEVADKLGISTVLIPREAGDFSALGLLLSDHRHDLVRGYLRPLRETSAQALRSEFDQIAEDGRAKLLADGFSEEEIHLTPLIDMRYAGQSYEEQIPAADLEPDRLAEEFQTRYKRRYGYQRDASMCEIVNLRVTATGSVEKPSLANPSTNEEIPAESASVIFADGAHEATVSHRDSMPSGARVTGPAIVEEYSSTMVVPPGWSGEVNELGCVTLRKGE
jgi:N-methylhydantoinase A